MAAEKENEGQENKSPFGGFGDFEQQETKLASDIPVVVATIENVQAIVNIIAEAQVIILTYVKSITFKGSKYSIGNL